MGAKTALFTWGGVPREVLCEGLVADPGTARRVAARALPGAELTPAGQLPLAEVLYPGPGMVYAASFPGLDVLCCTDLASGLDPGTLPPPHLLPEPGERLYVHHMNSTVDGLMVSTWAGREELRLVMALLEDGAWQAGGMRDFEAPYWDGRRPPWDDADHTGPTPFHPMDLGEAFLLHDFGFVVEGAPHLPAAPLDPFRITMCGFHVTTGS